jgi:gliding motility-associated-like protein
MQQKKEKVCGFLSIQSELSELSLELNRLMLKRYCCLLLFVFTIYAKDSSAQSLVSRWQYSWGGNRQDFLNDMIPIAGNKYFFAGTAASDISCTKTGVLYGDEDFAVMVFDDAGNKIWEKTYGGDRWDQLHSAIKVQSGGYILTGETESGATGIKTSPLNGVGDFWVVRIDDNGNLLWEKSYGGTDLEIGTRILQTPDGGFLVAGLSLSNIPGYNYGISDYQLIKIDANGNLLWSKLYGGSGRDEVYDIIASSDGNYFLSGTSDSPVSGNKISSPIGAEDIWVIKVSPDGTKLWDKTYGTVAGDFRGRLLPLTDGNILIIEASINTGRIRKIDINGNQMWVQTCSGNNQDFFEVATQDVNSGNIYVAGTSKTDNFGCKTSSYVGGGWFSDIWIAVFDSAGNKIDDLDYGGNDADIPTDIDVVGGEVWITGWSDSPLGGNKTTDNCGQTADGWIIRLSKKFYINNQTPGSICNNQNNIKVHFSTAFDFLPGNAFTVQLSDANGSFASPVNIGNMTGIKSDSITVVLPPGLLNSPNYKLRIIGTQPADTTDTYPLWVHGPPVFNLGNDTLICENSFLTLNAGIQPTNSQYAWSNGSNSNSLIVNSAGLFWCDVQNSCGLARDSILVQMKQIPVAIIGGDTSFCKGSTIILRSNLQLPDVSYLWSTGIIADTITIQNGGLYWLKTYNSCGSTSDSLVAFENPEPLIHLDKNSVLCAGSTRVLDAGNGYSNYLWNTGSTTSTISINTMGSYWVQVTDNHFCIAADTAVITDIMATPSRFLPADTSICSFSSFLIRPLLNFSSYQWNTGSISNSITAKQANSYWLVVKDKYGCVGRDSIIVSYKECPNGFYMPTAFTPDDNGKNDFCRPLFFGNLIQFQFTIYNRWGQKVFESNVVNNGWNGKMNGRPTDAGVFVWTCNYQFEGEKKMFAKGSVVLIR